MKPKKKDFKKFSERFTDRVSWFLGSWVAVFFHTFWFTVWLIMHFEVSLLTFAVSLEAIFIGIFLLMASNRAEVERDKKEARQQKADRIRMEHDIKLDEKADRQLSEIKRLHQELYGEIKEIKKQIKQLSASKK